MPLFSHFAQSRNRGIPAFLHHTLHLFPRRFDHWLRDVGLAVDDSRKVIAQRCHRYFSDQLVQRDCKFASTSTRFVHVEIRSSRTRVIWFGKSRTIVDLRRTHSCSLDLYQRIVCYCLPPSTSSQYKHSNLHNSTIPSDSLPYWGLLKNHSRGYNYTSKTIVLHLLLLLMMTPSSHTCPARGLEFACSVHKQTSSER